jgi:glucose-1-phosphate cytidylyltransferase
VIDNITLFYYKYSYVLYPIQYKQFDRGNVMNSKDLADIPVVILAGGLGTRLREETEFRPKPMVEIGDRPIIWHIMKNFSSFGIRKFIVCLGYKGEIIREYFLNYQTRNINLSLNLGSQTKVDFLEKHDENDWQVTLVDTGKLSSTGQRLKKIKEFIGDRTFIATYGDGLANVPIDLLVTYHRSHSGIATLTAVHPTSRFGVVDISDSGMIKEFHEKPIVDDWINGGFFVLEPTIFDFMTDDGPFEETPLKNLVSDGNLYAFKHSGYWQPMDTYREYLGLNKLWDSSIAPWKTW